MIRWLHYHDTTAMKAVIQTVTTQKVKTRRKSSACVTSVIRRYQSKWRRMVHAMGGASTVNDDRDTWCVQLWIQIRWLTAFLIHGAKDVISMSPQPHSPTDPAMDHADFVVQGSFIINVTQQYHIQDSLQREPLNGFPISHMQDRRKRLGWDNVYQQMKHIKWLEDQISWRTQICAVS